MKILIVTGTSDRPESALVCGLADKGHEVSLLGNPLPDHKQKFIERGITVLPFETKSRFDLKATSILREKIKAWQPQIVHAFSGRTLAAAVRCKSVNSEFKLVTYRGTVGHLSKFDPASRCSFLNKKVDAVSCVSQAVANYLKDQGVPEEKLFTIYKGHDPLWYQSENKLSRSDLGIDGDSFIVICVANARPVKGVDVFIDAANYLTSHFNITFLVVGDIGKEKLLNRAKNPRIKFLGFRKDAQALVSLSNLLIVPSRGREGLPKALLEALAMKKAVIASKVGGIAEVIRNERDGLLIPPNDANLLARSILYLSMNTALCSQLGATGYDRLLCDFSVEQMIAKTELLYKNC